MAVRKSRGVAGRRGYIWRRSRGIVVIYLTLMCCAVLFFLNRYMHRASFPDAWSYTEPIFAVLTLFAAGIIGFFQLSDEWEEEEIPKKLTVLFAFSPKEGQMSGLPLTLLLERLPLSGESDIRQWAQQAARQFCNGVNLEFMPNIRIFSEGVQKMDGDAAEPPYMLFRMEAQLIRRPPSIPGSVVRIYWHDGADICEVEHTDGQETVALSHMISGEYYERGPVLFGNAFSPSWVRRTVQLSAIPMDAMKRVIAQREVVSFWGHDNTLALAADILDLSDAEKIRPRTQRPPVVITPKGFPMLDGRVFHKMYVLCPQYAEGFRPRAGVEVQPCDIAGWMAQVVSWI